MSLETIPTWMRYIERAFAFNFIAFSFVMFSCWFPTGFPSTLSTLAFIFAIPIFLFKIKAAELELNNFEKTGLALFVWLLLSVLWSDAILIESLGFLSEYRIYFMLPVFIAALSLNGNTPRLSLFAAMSGAFIALVTSYGLGLDWWEIEGALNSLANRIYHGFIMAIFLLLTLLFARKSDSVGRIVFSCVAVLIIYNVLNIETGRTGYLQIISVIFLFCILTFGRAKATFFIGAVALMLALSYLAFDRFGHQVDATFANVERMIVSSDNQSGVGHRLEYYRGAIKVGLENPLLGVGVGDLTNELKSRAETGEMRLLTDNVHSEFLNMFAIGGFLGIVLFIGFIGSIVFLGTSVRPKTFFLGDALIGLGLIISVSALFNSTIKDYGEKHALMIMLSILGASLVQEGLIRDVPVKNNLSGK